MSEAHTNRRLHKNALTKFSNDQDDRDVASESGLLTSIRNVCMCIFLQNLCITLNKSILSLQSALMVSKSKCECLHELHSHTDSGR